MHLRITHDQERLDGYWDHRDAVRPLQLHRRWVLPLWQEATPSRAAAHGPCAVCVSLFPRQWLCHRGRRPHPDGGALVSTTVGALRPAALCRGWRGPWPRQPPAVHRCGHARADHQSKVHTTPTTRQRWADDGDFARVILHGVDIRIEDVTPERARAGLTT